MVVLEVIQHAVVPFSRRVQVNDDLADQTESDGLCAQSERRDTDEQHRPIRDRLG